MDLSNDLVSQFAKITTGDKDKNKETTVYGTVKVYDGITCVKIDGSDLLTPVDTTTEVKEGERVTVLIKNHSAVITGNTSDPSAGVSTTDKISGNVTKVEADIGEFKELTTENFRATNAAIDNLTAKDAQIENLVATKASIEELEVVQAKIKDLDVEFINAEMANINDALIQKADIKDLEASNANIKELQADTARIDEALITKADVTALEATWADIDSLEADIAEIDTALIGKATVEELNAVRAEISDLDVTQLEATVADINLALINKADIEDLEATYADIEELRADTARIDEALINKAAIKDLEAIDAKIDNLEVDKLRADVAELDEAIIYKASISDLNATNATIQDLTARVGTINNAMMGKASIEELEAVEAKIEDLDVDILRADVADIEQAMINKANIADLNAANADIDSLNAQVANIQTLVGGNLTMDNMQSLNLTSDKVTVDNAFIKDAMIDSVTANKIMSGSIDTNKVTITSTDGSMTLTGSVQQFKDENGKVRIQIGKDSGGNFSFVLYDSTGNGVLIDEDGIKSSNAIADGLIVDSKVANNANISGSKLNIASVINAVNKDNSTTIKSNKIFLDEQNQSLEVAFNSLKTQVDTIQDVTIDGDLSSVIQQVQSNTTQINVNKGNISTLTSENTLRKEEIKDLDDNIKSVSTSMNDKYTSLEQDLSGFKTTVGQTYTTKTEFSNLNVGGRNYISNSAFINGSTGWQMGAYVSIDTTRTFNGHPTCKSAQSGKTANGWCGCISYNLPTSYCGDFKAGETYTISCWCYVEDTTTFDGDIALEMKGKKTDGTSELTFGSAHITPANLVQGVWGKLSTTITLGYDVKDCCVRAWVEKNGTAWFADFKMEKGNKATDWTPAPEDVQGEIDKVNNNLTTNYSTTSAMNSAITQKANEITNTVSQTYTTKTEFNNLQIGGRNLVINSDVLNSSFSPVGTYKGTRTVVDDTEAKSKKHLEFKCTTAGKGFFTNIFPKSQDKVGKTYTWSFWAKCNVAKSGEVGHECGGRTTISLTTDWQKFTHTWVFTDAQNHSVTWYMNWNVDEILYIRDFKIEEGTKATDWTPAPEDVQNEIDDVDNKLTKNYSTTAQMNSAITQKANEITNTVSQTYASKTELNNLQVGGKNLVSNSAPISTANWINSTGWNISLVDCDKAPKTKAVRATANTAGVTGGMHKPPIDYTKFVNGANYTISAWIRASKQIIINFMQEAMNVDNYVTVTTEWKYYTFTHSINNSAQYHSNIFYITTYSNIAVGDWFEVHSLKLEKGDKATDWTPAPEDVDSKIYDVESKIQQTADAWTATFASSGGYNLIRNSTGSNHSTRQWTTYGSDTTLTTDTNDGPTESPSRYYLHMKSENTDERYAYSTRFRLKPNTTYRFTGYFHTYTACKSFDVYVLGSSTINETDGSFRYDDAHIYRIIDGQNTNGVWKKFSVTFTTSAGVQTGYLRIDHNGYNSSGTNTPSLHWSAISLTQGEAEVPWSPHPDEIYSGTTTIDAQGIKVTQSDYNGYTSMRSDGFYINDGSKDAVSITKDGAVFTGKMVVQSGSTVPTSVLSGKVTSGQLDSAVTSDISTAKSNASTALSTANTAKSTADNVKSTVDSGKTNWNNAYNRVSEWAYGAVTGSTTIDGGLIEANTILANKIAIGDFNNYAVDPSFENGIIGNPQYTVSSDYAHTGTKSLKAGTNVTGYSTVPVGKPFSVQAGDKIYVEWYQYRTTSTSPFNVDLTIYNNAGEIYQYDITGNYTPPTSETKNQWNKYSYVATAEISGMVEPSIKHRTSNANTGYIYFDDIVIRKMTTGELIVDGAVSANKISSNAITTDKLAANAVTAAKISSGAITADKISAGAITSDKVAAGAITADKVAAGAIQAKHIAIGDYNNYSQLAKGKSIETIYGTALWVQGVNEDNHCYWVTSDNYFPFTANGTPNHFSIGDTLQFKFEAYTTEAANKEVGVWFYSDTDSSLLIFSISTNVSFSTGWNAYTVDLGPFTDDRIKRAQSIMLLIHNRYKHLEVRNATIQRKVAGTLIVDGSITAGKIAANAVTTDKLNANAVTAAKIASNAITADKITSEAITTNKLAANAITADKIAANAVTTDKLNANAVTSAKIATNAITADKVAAGAITTGKLAVKDGTNYSQLTDQTASQWGWTKQANSSDEFNCWYQRNSVARDNQISEYYPCKGGESLRVKADIFTSVYGQTQQNGTATATARPVSVMIFTQNTNNSKSYIAATRVTAASTSGTTGSISSVITLPAEARRFAVYIQIDGYPTFSGTLRVRNVIVNKMSSGELIVDGSITAGKIAAGAITADKIAAGAITADKIEAGAITADKIAAGAITADMISGGTLRAAKEINFVGGARIFGNRGENGAGLTISASEYSLTGASQSFLGGSWSIDNDLTVTGTSTLTGAVTTGGNLTVAGTAKSKTLNVTSTSTLSGGVTCGSTLSVTGASTLTGAVTMGSRLSVGGVLNLQRYDLYLNTIWSSVNAPAIKFGTDSYVVGHGGIHIIDTAGNAQTLRAGTIYANGTTVTSDRRKKMDIRYVNVDKQSIGDSGRMAPNTNITIQDMHEFIGSLPLTSFRYKEEVKSNRNLTHYGFLTQDIMYSKVGSELVTMLDENKRIGDEEDYTGYSVEKLLMFVCGALQEEIHQRQLLEKEIKNLKEGK